MGDQVEDDGGMSATPPAPGHRALRRGRISRPNQAYLVTVVTRDRHPVFGSFEPACIACRAFTSAHILADASLWAWVLMPDHVHWLLQLGECDPLGQVVSRMKAGITRALHADTGMGQQIWERAFHDHAIRRDQDVRAAARYIVANPLRAGLPTRVGDYPFWDAIWLENGSATAQTPIVPLLRLRFASSAYPSSEAASNRP